MLPSLYQLDDSDRLPSTRTLDKMEKSIITVYKL